MIEIDGRILVMGNIFFARILEEEHMVSGLKAQRRLAVYVALGLSTRGGLWFSAPSTYAAEHTYTQEGGTISGLEESLIK